MTITPDVRGHYPKGYPINSAAVSPLAPGQNLEMPMDADRPDLDLMKAELLEVQSPASQYHARNLNALDFLNSRWPGQTCDGRKWPMKGQNPDDIYPWLGASDTRVRLIKDVSNQHRTVESHALMNMKLQARSTRPFATARESQQATTLLNWQIFTQLKSDWHRESRLAGAYRRNYGAAVVEACWEQIRRLDRVTINTVQFGQWINRITNANFDILDVKEVLDGGSANEKELLTLIQAMSPLVDRAQARALLKDLRELRYMEVPVPTIYRSQPRVTALRPMIDVFFSPEADDLQRERWIDRVEHNVSEHELRDRIETEGYDKGFVEAALEHRGDTGQPWSSRVNFEAQSYGMPGGYANGAGEAKGVELHHFYWYAIDQGVPCLYRTVFHMNVDLVGAHSRSPYGHGQMPFHAFRFEGDHRPIVSSMGIPEIAYTWEMEQKVQFDYRTDRAALALTPPLMSDYRKIQEIKKSWMPQAIIPMAPGTREPKYANPPQYDPGSVQVSADIQARVNRFFWCADPLLPPQFGIMRMGEYADDLLMEWGPVFQQILKLDWQYIPLDQLQRVVGPVGPHLQQIRADVKTDYEISATVDLRNLDVDYLREKVGLAVQLKQMDTGGVIDSNAFIRNLAESLDYTLADETIQDAESATNKEQTDEIATVNRIVGSGLPEPLPQAGNYQLRLQTMMQHLQSAGPNNQRLQDPNVQAVLKNRAQYFQRQLQQQQNAMIGRLQVTQPFSKEAPMVAG